jgi:geranylgeranyl reductase family protein
MVDVVQNKIFYTLQVRGIMNKIHDVIVLGCGVAGASAAVRLAQKGADVLLIDKSALPRYKPCGGGIVARGVRLFPADTGPAMQRQFNSVQINFLDAELRFEVTRREPILHMAMREDLDRLLVDAARGNGAGLVENCMAGEVNQKDDSATVETSKGPFRGRYLLAADGAAGSVSRKIPAGKGARFIPAMECEVSVDPHTFDRLGGSPRFDFGCVPHGYAWLFPKKAHLSMGVLSLRPQGVNLQACFEKYLVALGIKKITSLKRERHLIPFGPMPDRFSHGRALLAGDAAGISDPVTLEGISFALKSAEAATHALLLHMENPPEAAACYEDMMRNGLEKEIRAGHHLARFIYGSARVRNFIFRRSGRPLCEAMVDVMGGARAYGEEIRKLSNYLKLLKSPDTGR